LSNQTYSSGTDAASSFAKFDLAFNVELHLVWELERLEIGVGEDGGAGSLGVFGGGEWVGEELSLEGATVVVGQFDDWASLVAVSSVGDAFADAHVKLWVTVNGDHEGHGFTNLDQAGGRVSEGTASNLY
jgi:hypothetical protein